MANDELDREYKRILEEERARGQLDEEPAVQERRRHPRLKVNPGDLPTEIDPWVFAIDISISGMAFYSDEDVTPGTTVNVTLTDAVWVEAKVLNSHLEKSDSPFLPTRYRLHCEFADEEKGKEFLVRLKEMENEHRETSGGKN